VSVRRYRESDWADWIRMSRSLFPVESDRELTVDMRRFLARPDAAVFIAERPDGSVCGYVEVGARSHADGCDTSPVGYIEAWYIDADVRRAGYGRALLAAAESWAVEQGYREMASDALIDNAGSIEAHKRNGYVEVDRIVGFRKVLPERERRP
jgi:aminoglycoside 6'-N-acetyltransferase I